MKIDLENVLTSWESGGLRVECYRWRGAYRVRTLRSGQISAVREAETERRARELFERVVEELWGETRWTENHQADIIKNGERE